MNRNQLAGATILLGVATFFAWNASKLELGSLQAPGPGLVPLWEASLLGLAGAAWFVSSLRTRPSKTSVWPRGDGLRMVLHISATLLGYIVLVGLVGYTLSTFLFFVVAASAWRRYSLRVLAISGGAYALSLYLLFKVLLHTPLPRNLLGLP